jgi:hypothetical protein
VIRIGDPHPAANDASGWAVPLTSVGHSLILLTLEPLPAATQALYVELLTDLATLASAEG